MNSVTLKSNKDMVFEIVFYILLSLYIINGVANNSLLIGENKYVTNPQLFYNIKIYFYPLALLILFVVGTFKDKFVLLIGILFYAFCVVVTIKSNTYYIVSIAGFMICAFSYVKNPKILARAMAVSLFTITIIIFIASQRGIIFDSFNPNRFGRTAHYFGFYWYTYLPTNFLFSWIMFTYSRKNKVSWLELFLFTLVSYIIYYYSTHRLGFYLTIIVIVLYVVFVKCEFIKINNKFMETMTLIGFLFSSLIIILLSLLFTYENIILKKINDLLTTRLALGKTAFERYPITLFGQEIILHEGGEYFLIDCGFIHALLSFGIIFFVIMMVMYTFIHWVSSKTNDTMLFVWVTAQMIYTVINNVWLEIETGTCLLIAAVYLKQLYTKYKSNKINDI